MTHVLCRLAAGEQSSMALIQQVCSVDGGGVLFIILKNRVLYNFIISVDVRLEIFAMGAL